MWWWSYLLTAVGVFGLYLAGRKVWWAWFVGLGAQGLWIAYAIATDQFGFLISAGAYGWVYFKNGRAWMHDHKRGVRAKQLFLEKINDPKAQPVVLNDDVRHVTASKQVLDDTPDLRSFFKKTLDDQLP